MTRASRTRRHSPLPLLALAAVVVAAVFAAAAPAADALCALPAAQELGELSPSSGTPDAAWQRLGLEPRSAPKRSYIPLFNYLKIALKHERESRSAASGSGWGWQR